MKNMTIPNNAKKILSIAGLYLSFFALGSFLPFYAAKKTADDLIAKACDEHKDLCETRCDDIGQVVPLEKEIGPIDNMELSVGMLFSVLFSSCLSAIPHFCFERQRARVETAAGGATYRSSGAGCMGKLRALRSSVLPTPYDGLKLFSSTILFSLSNIILLMMMANDISEEICDDISPAVGSNETEFDAACLYLGKTARPCSYTYPQASEADAKLMATIADDVWSSMLGVGIPLILIAGVIVTLAALSVVACVKTCISRNQQSVFAQRLAGATGINDNSGDFAMSEPGTGGGYDAL